MLGSAHTTSTSHSEAHAEGPVARAIENQTAKLPSDLFLWAAVGSAGLSLGCHAAGRRRLGLFVGQWVSPLLILGLYNKLVKVAGSDRAEHAPQSFDREASAETVVKPSEPLAMGTQTFERSPNQPQGARDTDPEVAAYRRQADREFGEEEGFGLSAVSDYPHDERIPTKPSVPPPPIGRMP